MGNCLRESEGGKGGGRALARAYPQHPRPSCHALLLQGGAVCLVQRAAEPFRGYWGLPGGAVELGETVADALRREVQEETGLTVELERFLGFRDAIERDADGRVKFHFVIFYYLARPTGGTLQAADDAAAAAWVPLADLHRHRITDSVRQCLAWAGYPGGGP